MKAGIISIGCFLPAKIRKNDDWPQEFTDSFKKWQSDSERNVLTNVPETTGKIVDQYKQLEINDPFLGGKERRIGMDISSCEAEYLAAKIALEKAGIDPLEINYIDSYSLVLDRIGLASSTYVADKIGAKNAYAIGSEAACATIITQLISAKAAIESGLAKYVLLTQSNMVLKAWPMMHPTSPGVGDAATAILVGEVEEGGILSAFARTHGDYRDSVVWKRMGEEGEQRLPWWMEGGSYYPGSFDPEKGKSLIFNSINYGAETTLEALKMSKVNPEEIDVFTSTQVRKWIPIGIAEKLNISQDKVIQTFEKYAQLGACTIVVNLQEAIDRNMIVKGSKLAFYSQGAGFTRGSALVEWSH